LTNIGEFGMLRKERPGIPAHYHTGIDIKRPTSNFKDEPIFSIYDGIVISVRKDGPYAQLIIEHGNSNKFWTVYEHVAGIKVGLNDPVTPDIPVARFMNKNELNKYGWQFDHFHFEVLKAKPLRLKYDKSNPERQYSSFSLTCFTRDELNRYFYSPIEFLRNKFSE
jgi:murein DD-endopeptidase MepM/ murein hydrolase activator NlpD